MSRRALGVVLAVAAVGGCPSPKMPSGPPPEYEDPPAPSWYDAGGGAAEAGADPGTTTTAPAPEEPEPQPADAGASDQ